MSIDVGVWNGMLPARREWGNGAVRVLPDEATCAFRESKENIIGCLKSFSIPCPDGAFIQDSVLSDWFGRHRLYCDSFDKAKTAILSARESIVEASRLAVFSRFCESWNTEHPDDPKPPPSGIMHASNLAASLVPREDDMSGMYFVSVRGNQHSFLFTSSDPRYSFVSEGDKRMLAWTVVDSLVAQNVRRLLSVLESSALLLNHWTVRQTSRLLDAVTVFERTDLMPELGLRDVAVVIKAELNRTSVEAIDFTRLTASINLAVEIASGISTVSGVLGRINEHP